MIYLSCLQLLFDKYPRYITRTLSLNVTSKLCNFNKIYIYIVIVNMNIILLNEIKFIIFCYIYFKRQNLKLEVIKNKLNA